MNTLKRITLLLALVGCVFMMNAQLLIGGGLGYNDYVAGPGVIIKGEFEIMEDIVISPNASYFIGSKIYNQKRNLLAFDVNGQYIIEIMTDELKIYPLAGLNFSNYKTGGYYLEDGRVKERPIKGNALGLNVGGGGRWYLSDQMSVFAELKYTVSDISHAVLGAGILLEL